MAFGRGASAALTALVLAAAVPAGAYEPDPVSDRLDDIADSTDALNREMNRMLAEVARDWHGPRDERHLQYLVWDKVSGRFWVHHIERYAMDSPEVERLPTRRYDSVYSGMPFWATRVVKLFGICPTVKLNSVYVGSDKLGHFVGQGWKFYRRWLTTHDEARAAEQSAYTERAIFGAKTTGVYSNGDLVANYEGYRFFRALLEDDVVPGRPAMFRWDGAAFVLQAPFDWRDYVNAYWDEGIDISHYDRLLYPHMRTRLLEYCAQYAQQPGRYTLPPAEDAALKRRYAHIGLIDTGELRLDRLCAGGGAAQATAH